jgi:hypothetical protein
MGINLTGYRAVHFGRNRYRIVYRWNRNQGEVEVWGIGKREAGAIYRMVGKRAADAGETWDPVGYLS